ncbi:hypothetical protein, partial [Aquisphaera insulae]|uniref:hypothetical protein n=1 Tax=Aquisphaera insulae TaxID=2712864 RepID=UPI00196A3C6D
HVKEWRRESPGARFRRMNLISDRLADGAKLIGLDVEAVDDPHAPIPGWSEDDPLFKEWQEAMSEYRRQVEDDPNRL